MKKLTKAQKIAIAINTLEVGYILRAGKDYEQAAWWVGIANINEANADLLELGIPVKTAPYESIASLRATAARQYDKAGEIEARAVTAESVPS